ncbi:Ebp2-domain-containing protein [Hyphopichia burtonii NRRL Y-1933]|uniref:Ebp2-domain-containing protein n=1 Tax=Hyphopichia burtonii NRRL Y-1933 TaxID=984485 RepID=A0A1E4RE09_9ASCO|nr:Ebp2-domain-containing protein [Hyphopichia burtonii NRRL Y-1933]ODV65508.1 Ebp2-domain-containing protein [Hyphopichia burtonii NRRL Y-1933]
MARRGTLKKQLKNQQTIDASNKAEKKEKSEPKPEPESESESEAESESEDEVEEPKPVQSKKSKTADYESLALSKKEQRKLKKLQSQIEKTEKEDESDESEEEEAEVDLEKLAASESESDINGSEEEEEDDEEDEEEEDEEEEDEEEQEDVPLSDAEIDSDADVVPHTKLTINNLAALKESLARIELPWSKHSFQEHQSVVSDEVVESQIKDIYDDTQRELAFYKQGLDAVKQSRATLLKLKVPFSRPLDYFAEMAKSDEHMDKLKNKLLGEAANKKASEDAKKQRQLKKFGKQVQHETLQKRAKEKRETLEKIKSLKKKRGTNELNNDDEFQIALEEATREDGGDNKRRKPNSKRLAKDSKYGRGGMKRFKRSNDAESSADVSGFSNHRKGGKPKSNRPGKSRRRH